MSRIRGKDTAPEKRTRSLLHGLGCRYRLHQKELPGKPDVVLPRYRVALFVHGCYWHRHKGCRNCTTPGTNTEFWLKKFERNVERDAVCRRALRRLGWRPVVVWECETEDLPRLSRRLRRLVQACRAQLNKEGSAAASTGPG